MSSIGASTYNFIATQSLGSATNTVTFSNIPQGYTDLVIIANVQVSGASGSKIQFNGDTGTNYSYTDILSYASTAASGRNTSTSSIYNNFVYGESITSGVYSPYEIHIPSYANTNMYKTMLWKYGSNTTNSNSGEYGFITGLWRSYNPITSITISCWNAVNYAVGTSFTLYGIKAADIASIIPTKAIGGDVIATDGTYTYHAFKNTGAFIPAAAINADVFVVAGGGSSGYDWGAGGGAGGIFYASSQALTAGTNYLCTVGSGGASYAYEAVRGNAGNNSQFGALTPAVGGGAGGGLNNGSGGGSGGSGGSGGGGNYLGTQAGGSSTQTGTGGTGYGNSGSAGYGAGNPNEASGGGGGAGGAGVAPTASNGGAGGVGLSGATLSIINSIGSTLNLGEYYSGNWYFAGGGGGAGRTSGGAGGKGGGGSYGAPGSGQGFPGLANTGGGAAGDGRQGGSGLIVVRYLS